MAQWTNWSGLIEASPTRIAAPTDEAELAGLVRQATRTGARVRAVGAAHSHAPLVPTDGWLIDTSRLAGVVDVDAAAGRARVRAGTRLADLGVPLREAGVALGNQGDIDRQALSGATATGTHGTGPTLQNFSASVLGMRLVHDDGAIVECDAKREPELFRASRLHLGAFGVVSELVVAVRPAYRLEERMWREPLDDVLDRIDALTAATRHFEFFWMPGRARAACKSLAETDAEPVYPLADEGSRVGWSYEVLANDRPDKHSEMEYSVPAKRGPDCLRAIRELVTKSFPELAWPLEYRTLAADDVWLSTAYERPSVTISVHQGIDSEHEPLFRACEAVFREFDGRPHWGKVHYRDAESLAALHPRYTDWWRVRDAWDPNGHFLNDPLTALRPNRP